MKKNLIIGGLIFIVVALALNTVFGWFTKSSDEILRDEVLSPKTDTIRITEKEVIIGKDTVHVVKYKPNEGVMLENNITKEYSTYVKDTLVPALKIAADKITELQRINATLSGQLRSHKTELDNERRKTTYYQGKYFSAKTTEDSLGSTIDYKYSADLSVITLKHNKWLRGYELETQVLSKDPNMRINGVEHFIKREYLKPNRWGLGVQFGYGINGLGQIYPYLGAGISYNAISL